MSRIRAAFASLSNRNFRLFFMGQTVSATGIWMQKVAQAWLVLELSGSGTLLGVAAALQHLPTLLLGPWGGVVGDRVDKRRLLIATQAAAAVLALVLGSLTATGIIELWMVLMLALALGCADAFDRPTRKSFVIEMVGPSHLMNAITLSSVVMNAAKTVGPAIAGFLISSVGLSTAFMLNALSYVAVIAGLLLMDTEELRPPLPARRGPGQLREAIHHVRRTPQLLGPLLLMLAAGTFAFEWTTTLPLLARDAFGGDATVFGLLFSALGTGAVVGGLGIAASLEARLRTLLVSAGAFGALLFGVAAAPTLPLALLALLLVGAASMTFKAQTTSLVQLCAAPQMRGRVTALLTVTIAGTTPVGGPLVGWIGEAYGARVAVGTGALATLAATIVAARFLRGRDDPAPASTGRELDATHDAASTTTRSPGAL